MSFFDTYKNLLPNSQDKQSENPSTFNASLFFSIQSNRRTGKYTSHSDILTLVTNKYITNGRTWRTMENDLNPRWSHDEKVSALACLNYIGSTGFMKTIPLFASFENPSWLSWLRPDILAYTLICKYPKTRLLLLWIIHIKFEISILDFNRDAKRESSGIQKSFIMAMGIQDNYYIKRLSKLMPLAMEIYYPESNHPIRDTWSS